MSYAIYLRKSQADLEAEASGVGETLSRHRRTLLELAKRQHLEVGAIYEEIVSGETIAARPQMQKLLSEVGEGRWQGVLVMEVERLARGDSIDQGIVSQAFKFSGTKIITPLKTYDPSNEFDEEYLEFGLFMSRREYQTIKRRMIAGRIASVKEGKYMGKVDPFGYRRVKLENEKGWTLTIVPEQAEIVRKIFYWYLNGESTRTIAKHLKVIGSKTRVGQDWSMASISALLRNPLYCGYVTWGHKTTKKTVDAGRVTKKRYFSENYIKVRGRHEAIIPEEDWDAVQHRLKTTPGFKIRTDYTMRNPFIGLLYCAECGHAMTLNTTTRDGKPNYGMMCPWPHCNVVSSRLPALEQAVQAALCTWLENYKTRISKGPPEDNKETELQESVILLHKELERMDDQLQRAFDLVEQGIYTPEQFVDRQRVLTSRKKELTTQVAIQEQALQEYRATYTMHESLIPRIEAVLRAYPSARSAEEKNHLLRSVLQRINYRKFPQESDGKRKFCLDLDLVPLIPNPQIGR